MRLPPLKRKQEPLPAEEASDPGVPVVKADLRAAVAHVEASAKRGLVFSDIKALTMMVVGVVGATYAVLHTLEARGQTQIDSGVTQVTKETDLKLQAVQQQVNDLKSGMARIDHKTEDTQATVNAIAIRLGVQPVRTPAPSDAGK